MLYFRVYISTDFIKNCGNSLSQRLHSGFDPDHYVDTQIAMFLIGACVPAMTKFYT
ncbi:hypothetical protein D3C72_2602350 [compost metagenome]